MRYVWGAAASVQVRNRQTVFVLLQHLVQAQPGILAVHMTPLVSPTVVVLHDKAAPAALKIDVLAFLRQLFRTHTAEALAPSLTPLLPPVLEAATNRYTKTAVEALNACLELARCRTAPALPHRCAHHGMLTPPHAHCVLPRTSGPTSLSRARAAGRCGRFRQSPRLFGRRWTCSWRSSSARSWIGSRPTMLTKRSRRR